jgi:hypothetical protein
MAKMKKEKRKNNDLLSITQKTKKGEGQGKKQTFEYK